MAAPASGSPPRFLFIDALRGFDMFWITGGDVLCRALAVWLGWHWLDHQMEHLPWEGFVFYDLIFPLFVFIVGIVLPMSLRRYESQPSAAYPRILRRFALLLLLGLDQLGPAPVRLPRDALARRAAADRGLLPVHGARGAAPPSARAGDPCCVAAARLLGPARLRPGARFPGRTTSRPRATWSAMSIDSCCPDKFCCYPLSATTKACCRTSRRWRRAFSARSRAGGSCSRGRR